MESERKVVPYRIKQARISRGLSMVELSDLVSVSKQEISQYEMGKNAPSKAILVAYMIFLISSGYLKYVLRVANALSTTYRSLYIYCSIFPKIPLIQAMLSLL